jgi:hypothetical protein
MRSERPVGNVGERYELEALAGAGGMGTVHRARDRETGEVVALKRLRGEGASLDRFRREIRLLAGLDHPGIVRYVDSGETAEGEPYLVMEWLTGETLEARLARAELSIAESVALLRGAAEALGAAHALGVIHRDVKPSNLFLVGGRTDRIKVLDFGAARRKDVSGELSIRGDVLGTLGYMAPEQAAGRPDRDARADVFALGLVAYRCLARRPAFAADYAIALLAKLVLDDPPPLSARCPEVPPALDALVMHMLAKAPEARPADGAAVAEALRALGDAEAARGPAVALTRRERRLVSALLVRLASPPDGSIGVALPPLREEPAALRPRSAGLTVLADGTLVALIEGAGAATDLAVSAVRAALDLGARHPGAAVAVATGRVEDGAAPSGEVIDRAAALLAGSAPGAEPPVILLDDVTASLAAGRFEVRVEGGVAVLAGERAAEPPRAGGEAERRALPFLGRDRELAYLLDLFDDCVENDRAAVVLVTAPAGGGKSRLAAELVARIAARGEPIELLRAEGDLMREASPLALIAGCVQRAAGLRDGEPREVRQEKLAAAVARRVPESDRDRVAAFLGELVRTPFPEDGRPTLQQARRHATLLSEEMRRAFEDFLGAACAGGPLVLVAEDIHWADAPSLRYLDGALRRHARRPFFVIALARPEVRDLFPGLFAERDLHEISLPDLRPRAAEEIVRAALREDVPPETVRRIVAQAGGNAFCLEELIRAAAEGDAEALPDTVLAAVEARLGALPAPARAVLRAASVFGEVFWKGGVDALLGGDRGTSAWVEHLVTRDVVVRRATSRLAGEEEIAFRHALLRDGAYAALTDADRETGHRLAGAWLEARGEADARILAGHYERGGRPDRAAKWCLSAAEEAFERDDLDAAAAAAEHGLAIARAGSGAPEIADLERVLATIARVRAERTAEAAPPLPAVVPASSYRFSIAPGARIFVEVCAGRWSRDFTHRYVAEFKEQVAPLLGRPWGKLCNLDAWLPTEPDAAETLIEFLRWSIESGMTRVAYVISNPSARLQARRIIESSNVALMCAFFAAEGEAMDWLRRSGLAESA